MKRIFKCIDEFFDDGVGGLLAVSVLIILFCVVILPAYLGFAYLWYVIFHRAL